MNNGMPRDEQGDLIVVWADEIAPPRRHLIGDAIRNASKHRNLIFADDINQVRETETARILIVLHDPVFSLARRLEAGETAGVALAGWKDWARALLSGITKARRRITLVEDGIFFAESGEQAGVMTSRCGLGDVTRMARPEPDLKLDGLSLFAASALLLLDDSVRDLVAELRALTLGVSRPAFDEGVIETVLSEAKALKTDKVTNDVLRETLEFNGRLLDDCHIVISGLKTENTRLLDLLAHQDLLRAENESLLRRLSLAKIVGKHRDSVLGATILNGMADRDAFERRLKEGQVRVSELEAELSRVYGSSSWKVTGLARAARSKLSKRL